MLRQAPDSRGPKPPARLSEARGAERALGILCGEPSKLTIRPSPSDRYLLAALLLFAGCAAPLRVERLGTHEAYNRINRSALAGVG
jgi:hypothetical protein